METICPENISTCTFQFLLPIQRSIRSILIWKMSKIQSHFRANDQKPQFWPKYGMFGNVQADLQCQKVFPCLPVMQELRIFPDLIWLCRILTYVIWKKYQNRLSWFWEKWKILHFPPNLGTVTTLHKPKICHHHFCVLIAKNQQNSELFYR